MPDSSRRRNALIAAIITIILVLLLLTRCVWKKPAPTTQPVAMPPVPAAITPGTPPPAQTDAAEKLTPATLTAPAHAAAGSAFSLSWTGPGNSGDFITIVRRDAPDNATGETQETKAGAPLELTAPIEPGPHELRYVTGRSRTILGRAPIEVDPVTAAIEAPPEIALGAPFSFTWTGPDNKGDFVTIVAKNAPDATYGVFSDTAKGSPVTLTAPTIPGDAELRYVSADGHKVLARRPIKVMPPDVTLSGPAEATAGTTIEVTWKGPNNDGDYITLVASEIPDGQYGNYTQTDKGSPLQLLVPIMAGPAELRYMTGQDGRVLARRPITVVAARVTLSAPAQCAAGSAVSITWTGPNNPGDYITIVAKDAEEGQYGEYTLTTSGSPLSVNAPREAGNAEIRYVSGQVSKVLARIPIKVVP